VAKAAGGKQDLAPQAAEVEEREEVAQVEDVAEVEVQHHIQVQEKHHLRSQRLMFWLEPRP
jgi:hypothetical protein